MEIEINIGWLILTACQPDLDYFMARDQSITYIVHLYLHIFIYIFWVVVLHEVLICSRIYQVKIIFK